MLWLLRFDKAFLDHNASVRFGWVITRRVSPSSEKTVSYVSNQLLIGVSRGIWDRCSEGKQKPRHKEGKQPKILAQYIIEPSAIGTKNRLTLEIQSGARPEKQYLVGWISFIENYQKSLPMRLVFSFLTSTEN